MNACAHGAGGIRFAGRARHANRRRHDFSPFADDTGSVSIGTLMIENGTDRIAVYGSVDITRDQQGLGHARALLAVALRAVQLLEEEKGLPAVLPIPTKPKTAPSRFE